MDLPKKFNKVFIVDNPENSIETHLTITQVVLNNWTPMGHFSYGHKHYSLIQFDNDPPELFNLLIKDDSKNIIRKEIKLGLCNSFDFDAIKLKINKKANA